MNTLEKLFGTDDKKENEGVWVEYDTGIRFLVAAFGNKKSRELGEKLIEPFKRFDGEIRVPSEKQEDLLLEVKAHTILLDWDGIKDAEGLPIPYTPAVGKATLKSMSHFSRFIDKCSANIDLYRRQATEAAVKN